MCLTGQSVTSRPSSDGSPAPNSASPSGIMVRWNGLWMLIRRGPYSSLIYPRFLPEGSRTEVASPSDLDVKDWEEVRLKTKDGEELVSYFLKATKPKGATVCPALPFSPFHFL